MTWTVYRSDDASAPSVSGTAGALITLLDAILVNGYGAKPAAGWTKPFSGTNLAAYRMSTALGANGHYLRVDDTGTQEARWTGFESMSAISTGTGEFPTSAQLTGGLFARKSSTADATARPWICFADEKRFYLWIFCAQTTFGNTASTDGTMWFGQGNSYVPSDAFFTFAIGRAATGVSTERAAAADAGTFNASIGHYVARAYTGVGTSFNSSKTPNDIFGATRIGIAASPYPGAGGELNITEIFSREASDYLRGIFPGIFSPVHNLPANNFDTFSGTGDLAGVEFLLLPVYESTSPARIVVQTNGEVE
jgi:hypothetical protein